MTFERILQVFDDILKQDPLYEVVFTSHGYTLLAWEPRRKEWAGAEFLETPEVMLEKLLCTYSSYLESKFTDDGERDDLTAQEEAVIKEQCRQLREACMSF